MRRLLQTLSSLALAALLFTGLSAFQPTTAAAACTPDEECWPDDPEDPWWEENCWQSPEDGECCKCDDPERTICAGVG